MRVEEKHIDFIDHIRGVAFLAVLLFHTLEGVVQAFHPSVTPLVLCPAYIGWVGVSIFFVISGFCIHLSHERSGEKGFGTFFIRRFFRIYPAYLVALVIFAASCYLRGNYPSLPNFAADVTTHLFMVHNYGFFYGINGSFWSLAVEVQLYLIYPLFLGLVRRFGWQRALGITAGIELILRTLECVFGTFWPGTIFDSTLAVSPFAYWYSWTIGAALAEAYLKKAQRIPFCSSYLWLCPPMFLVCLFTDGLSAFCFTLAALFTAFILGRLLRRSPFPIPSAGVIGSLLNHLRWWGIISYSAYLLHQPIVRGICTSVGGLVQHRLPVFASYFLVLAIAWVCVFPIAYLFHRYIEVPGTFLGKQLIRRRREELPA